MVQKTAPELIPLDREQEEGYTNTLNGDLRVFFKDAVRISVRDPKHGTNSCLATTK